MKQPKKEHPTLWKKNCKFAHSCHLYTKTSTTCTKKGGNYCGQYRELTTKLQAQRGAQEQKQNSKNDVTFIINPALYDPLATEAREE